MQRFAITLSAGLVCVGLTGCGSVAGAGSTHSSTSATSQSSATSHALAGTITVFAASSLKESFTKLGTQFEANHPGTKIIFSFAASSALASQITSGAPADVFASASSKNMDQVVSAGAAFGSKIFAKNVMEIAVPPTNPGKVAGVSSLASPSVKTALCQPQVPCGATAAKVFAKARVQVKPVTLEPDVKSVLTKIQLGEVDAGMVYVTDVLAAGTKVKGVQIPASLNASTSYPIAAMTKSANTAVASAFVDYVLSSDGASVLAAAGFEKP